MKKKARGKKAQVTKRSGATTAAARKAKPTRKTTKGGSKPAAKPAVVARAVRSTGSPAARPPDVGTYTPSAVEGIGWPPFRYSRQ
jgi:hypothetical protein